MDNYNTQFLATRSVLPLQGDYIPYSTNTMFTIRDGMQVGTTLSEFFSTNQYIDPTSTVSYEYYNSNLTSTLGNFVSTPSLTSSFQARIPLLSTIQQPTIERSVTTTLPYVFESSFTYNINNISSYLRTSNYDFRLDGYHNLAIYTTDVSNNPSQYYISTVAKFGNYKDTSIPNITTTSKFILPPSTSVVNTMPLTNFLFTPSDYRFINSSNFTSTLTVSYYVYGSNAAMNSRVQLLDSYIPGVQNFKIVLHPKN